MLRDTKDVLDLNKGGVNNLKLLGVMIMVTDGDVMTDLEDAVRMQWWMSGP